MNRGVWELLDELKGKKGITEIVINSPENIFVEREGQFIQLNYQVTLDDMNHFINDVANKNEVICDEKSPLLNGSLPDGSRVNAILNHVTGAAPAITIRKYIKNNKTFDNSIGIFGVNEKWLPFFKAMVSSRMNIVVSGGTGVGKTTFLNLLINEINPNARLITIEDTKEINCEHSNKVQMLWKNGGVSARDLVKNSLRMRPDRIIIGEVRGGELFDLIGAMNTGHEGSMTSVHANSSLQCLGRLENLYYQSGHHFPVHVVRRHICSTIDFIIQLKRDGQGNRYISEVLELTGMEGESILTQPVLIGDEKSLTSTGLAPSRMEALRKAGKLAPDFFNNDN